MFVGRKEPGDPILEARAARENRARNEASTRILDLYPDYAQRNAALGIYDDLPHDDTFNPANMKAGIEAIRESFAAALVAINALSDPAAIEAFIW